MADQLETLEQLKRRDDMWQRVCRPRFEELTKENNQQDTVISKIFAKVSNGFGDKIEAVDEKVDELKKDTNKRIDDLKTEIDKRFDKTDLSIEAVKKAANRAVLAIILAVLGAAGTGIAALLTGLFGLLEKFGGG